MSKRIFWLYWVATGFFQAFFQWPAPGVSYYAAADMSLKVGLVLFVLWIVEGARLRPRDRNGFPASDRIGRKA